MKIYVAASYFMRYEAQDNAAILASDGHTITSVWLSGIHELPGWTPQLYAHDDLRCIDDADVFIAFTEPDDAPPEHKRGGRHVEFGYAYAQQKRIIIVGPRENSFYHLKGVEQYNTLDEARTSLQKPLS